MRKRTKGGILKELKTSSLYALRVKGSEMVAILSSKTEAAKYILKNTKNGKCVDIFYISGTDGFSEKVDLATLIAQNIDD